MKKYILSFVFVSFVLFNLGCKKSPTEIDKPPIIITPPSLELSVDGVSCTEAWIKVKKLNDTTFLPISVKINEKEFFHGFLAATDTVLFVDSLAPSTTYTVKGIILDTLQTAKELKVTTLPTTSHNFTWQTFEFGDYNPSALMDVTIIDENNIWAVGKIYMNDSLGHPDPNAYNAVHWDGSKWDVKRIKTNACGGVVFPPIEAIFSFSASDLLFAHIDGSISKYNGIGFTNDCSLITQLNGSVNKMWGKSNVDFYVVSGNGFIAHYNGVSWQKLESGTDFTLTDIFGSSNENVYSAGSKFAEGKGIVLRRNKTGQFETMVEGGIVSPTELFHPKLYGRVNTLWVDENNILYTAGDFLYQYKNGSWSFVSSLPENHLGADQSYIGYIYHMRGNASNDILMCGDMNTLRHFNGQSWEQLGIPFTPTRHIFWRSVAIKGNIAVAVGDEGDKATIIVLKR